MYLYVSFDDTWGSYNDAMFGHSTGAAHKRIKKIKLTDEQIKELKPNIVGENGGFVL